MSDAVRPLIALTHTLQQCHSLEDTLQAIAQHAAAVLGTTRVSVRLLDPSRTRLMATARAGEPMHAGGATEFTLGEGLIGWIAQQSLPIRVPVAEDDPRFVVRPGQPARMGAFLGVPILSAGGCLGVLSGINPTAGGFTLEHEELLTLVAGVCAPYVEVARLARLAHRDPLTGTLNRRGLELVFPEDPGTLTVAIGDVDHFKQVNDVHGHPAGDQVLKHIADLLGGVVRAADAVVRFGGEEFVLILPGVDLGLGARIAERARGAIAARPVALGEVGINVTMSFGVAERRPGEPRDDVIARADGALYLAKQAGRNRVQVAE